jgi:hypothetical protein
MQDIATFRGRNVENGFEIRRAGRAGNLSARNVSSRSHFRRDGGLLALIQCFPGNREHDIVFNLDVIFVNRKQIRNGLPESARIRRGKPAVLQAPLSQRIDLGMQQVRAAMILFKCVQRGKRSFQFPVIKSAEAREKRFFFIGGVLWGRVAKIEQSRFQRGLRAIRERSVDDLSQPCERSKKHLNPPMAV